MTMSNGENKKSFWTSLPGILTGIGGVIAAIASILAVQYGGNTLNPGPDNDSQIDSPKPPPESAPKPPRADAGIPKTVNEGDIVTLDGTNSYDPEGKPLKYDWKQTDGFPLVRLSNINAENPTFKTPDVPQDNTVLTFSLKVTDESGIISTPSLVTVTINNVDQPLVSDNENIATDDRDNDVTPNNTAASVNNSLTEPAPPSNANKQVTLKYEASFIPEELRNPGLKSFTHSIKVGVDARPQIIDLIKNITYYPQPSLTSFQKPVTRDSRSDNFAFSFNALEDFELKAKIYFKDGNDQNLSISISFP
jgi:hypothetical protein